MKKVFIILALVYLQFGGWAQNCPESTSFSSLNVNNVEAGLLAGGDLWWNLSDGQYIVPKPQPGENPVNAIFAGAIWIGGTDNVGNLKLATQTYRQNGNDYWPGPILANPLPPNTCQDWDRHFTVYGSEITAFLDDYNDNGTIDDPIPANILGWPGSGNPNVPGLPNLPIRDLAPFKDQNMDGVYEPGKGDHPVIGLEDCQEQYADQMTWWVMNDIGNAHTHSEEAAIGLEVQVMAYAFIDHPFYSTTFYTYDIINQSTDDLLDTYIGQWTDVDLGCYTNDYVGCDSARSMAIAYNGAATDPDCHFFGGTIYGYGSEVPLLGFDLLSGPKDNTGQTLPMTTFVVFNNDGSPTGNPNTGAEYMSYLKGFWKDGSPVEYGGDGYQENTFPYPFMFPSDPSGGMGWSECSENNPPTDRRFVMGSGPFDFPAGSRKEFTLAVIFEADVPHPCPSFTPIQLTSDSIQALFDNCFDPIMSSNEQVIPEELQSLEVYPNPTTIGQGIHMTQLPANSVLEITTTDGKRVHTYHQSSGIAEDVFWNLRTDNGVQVAQGLYFVSVRLEGVGSRVFKVSVY